MFSASLVQLGTTRNYIAVDEKFLGFVLIYELACTELHGSGSSVKRIDPFLRYKSTRLCSTAWLPFGLPTLQTFRHL